MAAAFCTELNMILKNKFNFSGDLFATMALFANFKEEFNKKLEQYDRCFEGTQKQFWSKERIATVKKIIKTGRAAEKSGYRRTPLEIYWMGRCDIIKKGKEHTLIIYLEHSSKNESLPIVPREKYFDILSEIHTSCNHGGKHRMWLQLKKKCFIPRNVIRLFVAMCPGCLAKKLVVKNATKKGPNDKIQLNVKGRVNLINFKYCPDGEYKWLLSYQDDGTKYLNLRPLKTIMAPEVAYELMKIFLTFGAPTILQLDMDIYHMAQVKQEIIGMWPNCQVVPKTNSKANECDKQELEYIIQTWMARNDTTKWSIGCFIVQHNKNNSFVRVLGNTPYKMMFGSEPRVELSATNIPARILGNRGDEDDVKGKIKQEPIDLTDPDEEM